jgi:hypothetical protein
MGTINNNNNSGQQKHDGQKNYQHSNQRNPDNVRNNTRDHTYKDHDEELTNDANFDSNSHTLKGDMDFDDTKENVNKNNSEE